jgi:hypothetical protein
VQGVVRSGHPMFKVQVSSRVQGSFEARTFSTHFPKRGPSHIIDLFTSSRELSRQQN